MLRREPNDGDLLLVRVPDFDDDGKLLVAGWGKVGGEGSGVHVIDNGKFACSGAPAPKSDPTLYMRIGNKEATNPHTFVYCNQCNTIISKMAIDYKAGQGE